MSRSGGGRRGREDAEVDPLLGAEALDGGAEEGAAVAGVLLLGSQPQGARPDGGEGAAPVQCEREVEEAGAAVGVLQLALGIKDVVGEVRMPQQETLIG